MVLKYYLCGDSKHFTMINKVTLVGHLGKDPEVRTLENGSKVGTFSLATNESYKDKNDVWQNLTEWHNIVVWRYLAEKAERELKKGSLAFIEGKITHRKYTDKDNQERTTTDIVASTLQSLDKKESSGREFAPMPTSEYPTNISSSSGNSMHESKGSNDAPADNDDLPF